METVLGIIAPTGLRSASRTRMPRRIPARVPSRAPSLVLGRVGVEKIDEMSKDAPVATIAITHAPLSATRAVTTAPIRSVFLRLTPDIRWFRGLPRNP